MAARQPDIGPRIAVEGDARSPPCASPAFPASLPYPCHRVNEFEAATKLKLELADPRTEGYDAIRESEGRLDKVQVKGRRLADAGSLYKGRISKIDLTKPFDSVVLVLLDENYDAMEVWEAPRDKVESRLSAFPPRGHSNVATSPSGNLFPTAPSASLPDAGGYEISSRSACSRSHRSSFLPSSSRL